MIFNNIEHDTIKCNKRVYIFKGPTLSLDIINDIKIYVFKGLNQGFTFDINYSLQIISTQIQNLRPKSSEQYFQYFCHFIINYLNLKSVCNELSFCVEIKAVG